MRNDGRPVRYGRKGRRHIQNERDPVREGDKRNGPFEEVYKPLSLAYDEKKKEESFLGRSDDEHGRNRKTNTFAII